MPIKNGMDCLLEIRSEELLKEINVIIYSTSANKREIEESYKNGANLYIQKPVNYSDLKSTLVKVFSMDWTNYRSKPPKEWFAWLQSMGKHDY
jgi:response regulator of citrate/malate metabolism